MNGTVVAIGIALVGLATVAVLVSKNSNTAGVFQAAGTSLGLTIQAATGPVRY